MLKKLQDKLKGSGQNLGNYKKLNWLYNQLYNDYKSAKVNLGQLQAENNRAKKNINSLAEVEFQVFSQFGDDGIIQWLVQQLPIPNKTFIEFGVEDYREANTRFLLVNNQWSGLVMDGSEVNVGIIQADQIHTFFDLQAQHSFITVANINELIDKANFAKEVGILSVDIDGNDYWVLKAIDVIEPVIIICEYNSLFGFEQPYTIAYKEDFVRGKEFPFQYYGTSLKSAYNITKEKGYSFIGCNSAGNNAYFIKDSYMQYLSVKGKTATEGYVFANFTEAFDSIRGEWLRGLKKVMSIDQLPVFNTTTGQTEKFNAEAVEQSLINNNKLKRF